MSGFFKTLPMCWPVVLSAALAIAAGPNDAAGAPAKGRPMTYGEVRAFLVQFTDLVELTNEQGARVAIAPGWQGRMTSTCGGMEGQSFGFINSDFIREGKPDAHFNNYGGEERLWLSPEGGQFSLWFKPGERQHLDNWFTPAAYNEGPWKVVSGPRDPYYRMATTMKFQNASGTHFHLDVARDVRLLAGGDFAKLFGESAAKMAGQAGVHMVAYETANRLTNRAAPLTMGKGLVSMWILGMMNSGPETVVIVPYRAGDEKKLGPVVKSDYFGAVPPERLKITPQAVLFRADGNCRSKIGVSQRRVRNVLGSIDFQAGVLTLVNFTMPDDPAKDLYMNNMWGGPHREPYTGDVANSYNDGPPEPGKKGMGPFYEIESLSPAMALRTGQSLEHCHRTVHIQADSATLAALAKDVLGVELESVRREMLQR